MFDIPNDTSWIGQPLGCLPDDLARQARREMLRPTIRAFPYKPGHRNRQQVASYEIGRVRNKHHRVFTTVGGGVENGDGWAHALQAELAQELSCPSVTWSQLQTAHILVMHTVSTSRTGYRGKLVVVVGVPFRQFHSGNLEPSSQNGEIKALQIGTIAQTAGRLHRLRQHTPREMFELYRTALSQLRVHCSR